MTTTTMMPYPFFVLVELVLFSLVQYCSVTLLLLLASSVDVLKHRKCLLPTCVNKCLLLNILSVIFYYPSQYNTMRWLSIVHNKIVSDKKICNNVKNIMDIKRQRVGTLIAMEQSLPGNFFTKRSKTYDLAGSGMFNTYIFYKKNIKKIPLSSLYHSRIFHLNW